MIECSGGASSAFHINVVRYAERIGACRRGLDAMQKLERYRSWVGQVVSMMGWSSSSGVGF